jgi:hypothetical protein
MNKQLNHQNYLTEIRNLQRWKTAFSKQTILLPYLLLKGAAA